MSSRLLFTSLCGVDVKPTLQKKRLRLRKVKELAPFAKNQSKELGLKSITTRVLIPLFFCCNTLPLGPCLDALLGANKKSTRDGRERERKRSLAG